MGSMESPDAEVRCAVRKKIVLNKNLINLPLPPIQPLPVVLQMFKQQTEKDAKTRAALIRTIRIRQAQEQGEIVCEADFA